MISIQTLMKSNSNIYINNYQKALMAKIITRYEVAHI